MSDVETRRQLRRAIAVSSAAAGSPDWAAVQNKPTTFTPATHSHAISDVTGLQTSLDGKAALSHTHTALQISDSTTAGRSMLTAADAAAQTALLNIFTSSLKGLVPASGGGTSAFLRADGSWSAPSASVAWGGITGTLSSQTDLQTALDAKAASSHTHAFSSLTSIPTTISGYGITDAQPLDSDLTAIAAISTNGILKRTGASTWAIATSGTDYAPATSGSTILKGNGAGGFSSAVSGADYAPATSGSSVLKGNGSGGFSLAVDGTDIYSSAYAIPNANIQNGINNGSQTAQSQIVVSGTAYYITRSNLALPAASKTGGGMVVGTRFLWRVALTKTAAGTGTFQLRIYRGTNGSTADTADVTQTLGTQTAVVDNMTVDVMVTVTATGATGSYYWSMAPINKAASATGFGIVTGTGAFSSGTVSSVALNTASLQFGLGFISTTGTPTIAVPLVHGQVFNMS